ncbi:uncharacterized protein STEHIDRAFT_171635 [Stereum hirsutum FP-91666 SS1]|uniref:uncharacterized protein n=1 Tax=Stereum hirsutum (strain FP-91666) TaxID=721885 RepID=UPI000444A3BE|nr:uncharacterized protein STEHIDRAFT_171635 [Stereum hirsutum FP-91666 SS1]EIM82045.1 hypothetical protein STEHIDRAFT_171635 [Stereum hirsutum FP-91666 SS1]
MESIVLSGYKGWLGDLKLTRPFSAVGELTSPRARCSLSLTSRPHDLRFIYSLLSLTFAYPCHSLIASTLMAPFALITASLLAAVSTLHHRTVSAAPFSIDDTTMLQNGQAAQTLNAEFLSLSANSTCSVGETACISGEFATCTSTPSSNTTTTTTDATNTTTTAGTWDIESCASGQQCFALPFVRSNGTYVSCVSQSDATTLIASTGTTGGLIATTLPSNTTLSLPLSNATDIPTTSTTNSTVAIGTNSTSNSTIAGDGTGTETTTITITLPATGATSLPSVTTTLNAAEASSLLASLSAAGASIVTEVPASTTKGVKGSAVTSVSVATATASGSNGVDVVSASSSVIQLTPKASATSS